MKKLLAIFKKYPKTTVFTIVVCLNLFAYHNTFAAIWDIDISAAFATVMRDWLGVAARFVGIILLWTTSFFVYLCGVALDYIIFYTVVKMGQAIDSLPGIQTGWLMFRDLTNLAFIFALIYTGILMIIDANLLQKKGMLDYRKMLVMLVIAALLVNFSLFFTKALVDISNVVSTKLYDLTNQKSLSVILMNSMSVSKVATSNGIPTYEGTSDALNSAASNAATTQTELSKNMGILIRGIFGGFIYIVAGLSFLAISFFLLLRFVLVIYLLISSPVYFASLVLPSLRTFFGNWLRTLVSQCLFPIVYFLILLVILFFIAGGINPDGTTVPAVNIATVFQGVDGVVSGSAQTNANLESSIGITFAQLLQFILVIIGLIGGLKLAVNVSVMGASGADAAIRKGSAKLGGYVTRKSFGMAGGAVGGAAAAAEHVGGRIPLVGKPIASIAGGVRAGVETAGKGVGYGVNQFEKFTNAGPVLSSAAAGVGSGYSIAHKNVGEGLKKYSEPDEKQVNERLEARKKEVEAGVENKKENKEKLETATKRVEETRIKLDEAQRAFRNAKGDIEKARALEAESKAEEAYDDALEKLGDANKEIARDKKVAVAEWRSNAPGKNFSFTQTRRSIRRLLSPTERAAVAKSALETPKEAKDQLADKADRLNVRLANMIDTGKTADEITKYLKDKKNKVTPAVMAFIKPALLLNNKVLDDKGINPILRFMTPAMLTAFSKEEKSGGKMSESELEQLHKELIKRRNVPDNSIDKYLKSNQSDWLPDVTP